MIKANNRLCQGFPHAEYLDMTFLGAFRTYGMKNPGYKIKPNKNPNKNETKTKLYTFIGYVYQDGIAYDYIVKESNKVDANDAVPDPDPSDNKVNMAALGAGAGAGAGAEKGEEAKAKGGSRRTSRRRRTLRKINKRKNAKKVTQKKNE